MTGALHEARHAAVEEALLHHQAISVADLGCGDGALLARLCGQERFARLAGIDCCAQAVAAAERLLRDHAGAAKPQRCEVWQASFEAPDRRLAGFDAALLVETIEHVDPRRLSAVEHAWLARQRPRIVVITTPNQEYNALFGMPPGAMRHPGHRFEWTRAKFRGWASRAAAAHGYDATFANIGPRDLVRGSPTQMAILRRAT